MKNVFYIIILTHGAAFVDLKEEFALISNRPNCSTQTGIVSFSSLLLFLLALDPNTAKSWINSNVIPFYPASKIIFITVGNEVILSNDANLVSHLLLAMQNLQNALDSASLGGKIKVSSVHAMAVLGQSEPPSSGRFKPEYVDVLKGILEFSNATGSPFAINPYPYFAYSTDPRPDTLAFCLFQPNAGRLDSNTNIKYMNMFDAQVRTNPFCFICVES